MRLTDIWPTLGKYEPGNKRRNLTSTKAGPGRKHRDGVKHPSAPTAPTGDWAGLHTNPSANARRVAKAEIGARQYRKQRKALARAAKELA